MEARRADALALEALASAKAAVFQARQLAGKAVRTWGRARAEENFLKPAQNRLAQAKRRAEAAEAVLVRAWGYHQASIQEAQARRVSAKAAHQQYKNQLKKAA
jgi:hypothetical protein